MSVYQNDISRMLKLLMFKYETKIRFTIVEISILEYIEKNSNVTQNELLDNILIKRSKLISLLKRLVDTGYIKKIKSDYDKRSNYLELGKMGIEVLENYSNLKDEFLNFVLDDMTVNEEKTIVKFLSKINQTKYLK